MDEALSPFDEAPVAVMAHVTAAGRPNACAVTPYVVDGHLVVTSTLAYITKAAAVRRDPRVALLAGGRLVRGTARVGIDRSPAWFDDNLRSAEVAKYPPARSVLQVPGHRRLFAWYVGRAVIAIDPESDEHLPGPDRVTAVVLDDAGRLHLVPLDIAPPPADATTIALPADLPSGPAAVHVHHESADLADLDQRTFHGIARDRTLRVERMTSSTSSSSGGLRSQLRTSRDLAARARRSAPRTAGWPGPPVGRTRSRNGPSDRGA